MTASFAYHDRPDIPPGMTLDEYRRVRMAARPSRRRRRWWLLRRRGRRAVLRHRD